MGSQSLLSFVTAGVHGLEFPGIQALVELSEEIEPEEVDGAIIFVPCVNTPAFFKRRAYICPDNEENRNFNMTFPGKADSTLEQKVAYLITETMTKHVDFHVDIHSSSLRFFPANRSIIPPDRSSIRAISGAVLM